MPFLYVRAHWTDQPPVGGVQQQPPPNWALNYPGNIPSQQFVNRGASSVPPNWNNPKTGPVPPASEYTVWIPVVKQVDLESSRWASSANWAGNPPPYWDGTSGAPPNTADMGYSQNASGVHVNHIRLYSNAPPGRDFTFTLSTPSGQVVGQGVNANGWSPWIQIPAGVQGGHGFWKVTLNRSPNSSASAPGLLPQGGQGNQVNESYVSLYGNEYEGVLGAQIDYTEITTQNISVSGSVNIGTCVNGLRGPSSLAISFNPPLTQGWLYQVFWSTAYQPPPPPPSVNVMQTVMAGGSVPGVTLDVPYASGQTYYPSAVVILTSPSGTTATTPITFTTRAPSSTSVVDVPNCPSDEPCPDIHLAASNLSPCVGNSGSTPPVTFSATVSQSAGSGWNGHVLWQVRDQTGQLVQLPAPTPTGTNMAMSFSAPGRYKITASIVRTSSNCNPQYISDEITVDVRDCNCPTIAGDILATRVNGCTFSFAATVLPGSNAAAIAYSWDFGDGTTDNRPPPVNHTYSAGSSGLKTVRLTVSSAGADCSQSKSADVSVDCGSGNDCPNFSGAISSAQSSPCSFDLSAAVNNPSNRPVTITWSLPGGRTAQGPNATAAIASGTTQTATAILTSPDCPTQRASISLSCGSVSPPSIPICPILLALSIILMLLGGLIFLIGFCLNQEPLIVASLAAANLGWLLLAIMITGIALLVIGLIIFIIWLFLCSRVTSCAVMRTWHCVLFYIVAVAAPIVSLLALLFGTLPCLAVALVLWGGWGSMYAWLGFIMRRLGCTPTC